jgi:hypothetical protein
VPGTLKTATQISDPFTGVIPAHQLMIFRHIMAYYDLIGPHDLPSGRSFTSLKLHASIPMISPFPFPLHSQQLSGLLALLIGAYGYLESLLTHSVALQSLLNILFLVVGFHL